MIKPLLASLVLTAAAAPLSAQESDAAPALNAEQSATLRCAAAFAIVSHGQANGNEDALRYPPLDERGREFFVRAGARLMDELDLDRAAIQRLVGQEAQALWDSGTIDDVMPACLLMLEASGL